MSDFSSLLSSFNAASDIFRPSKKRRRKGGINSDNNGNTLITVEDKGNKVSNNTVNSLNSDLQPSTPILLIPSSTPELITSTKQSPHPPQPSPPPCTISSMSTAVEWTTNTLQLRQSMSDKQHKGVRTVDKPCTLAVCQVIVDKLPTESIWHEWGKDAHQPQDQPSSSTQVVATGGSRLRLKYHIHAARPTSVTSPWVRSRLLPLTFSPKWNDFRIVRAALELIREAVRDESVTHAVVVTER